MTRPRALVLSGSIGNGHDAVAGACAGALAAAGYSPSIHDCMALLGPLNALVAKGCFRFMLARPGLYDGFHFACLRAGSPLPISGDRAARSRIVQGLQAQLNGDAVDLVLSVFATGVSAGAELARRRGLRSVVFCTDATAHSLWVDERTDLFLATCELAAATVRQYRPKAAVAVIPPPVRSGCYEAPCQEQARMALGLDADRPCALLVAGGWGVVPLAGPAAALASRGVQVLAVAGSNRRLLRSLEEEAARSALVHAVGFSRDMPRLIAAADVVVTGPGQTCHEARAIGRPLVLLDAVPGHGRENLLYELTLGGAASSPVDAKSVGDAVLALLESEQKLPAWPVSSERQWQELFLGAIDSRSASPA